MLPDNPKSNPIFQRLTRYPSTPFTVREAAWLAGCLGLLVLSFCLVGVIPPDSSLIGIPFFLSGLATWLVYPIASLFGAMMAASITGRDASTDLYQLMQQTPISSTDIVWAYIFTTLYRLRAVLALMIGLLPAVVFGSILIEFGGILFWLQGLGIQLALIVEQWGIFLFAVTMGVSEGLLHKKVFPGVIAAPLVVIVFRAVTPLAFGSMPVAYLLRVPTIGATFGFFGIRLVRAVLPYLLSLLFFRLACRWA
jgi:hypothetical protein